MTACLKSEKIEDALNNAEDKDCVIAVSNPRSPAVEDTNLNHYEVARMGVVPFDTQLEEYVDFSSPNFAEVSVNFLKSNEAIRNRLNYNSIDFQLLYIMASN